ncbi:hypothetical protein A3752_12360 [Oleiphilus sp. HI0081]|uniref:hypothetical protein n=1 Tax=Oleiphilus sp. HI0132 TaxID=1822270 RepID=UPI0007C3A97E|nr:hypothetical protein [Oleiphilus sp. HI0132]KZY92295.1 hypothetical protein A3743_06640 [Oleiphilus sp. HI0072]KZZ10473.1 hypothetical protein A3749_11050 [Oleiphilus sp. HI0078]KZZ20220.1 hypothetical protein A3752_12360 [Oleiphilus sp. HI0081]KZZ72685.1 hypothetical protein A3766_06785 [Oleiphilus sp. HI0132]
MSRRLSLGIGRVKTESNTFGYFDVVDRLIPGNELVIDDNALPCSFNPKSELVEDKERYSSYLNHCPWVFELTREHRLKIEPISDELSVDQLKELEEVQAKLDGNFWLLLKLINIGEFPDVPELEDYRLCVPFVNGICRKSSNSDYESLKIAGDAGELKKLYFENEQSREAPVLQDVAWMQLFGDFAKQEFLEKEMDEKTLEKRKEVKRKGRDYFSAFEAAGTAHKLVRPTNVNPASLNPLEPKRASELVRLAQEMSLDKDSE